jgi:pimeloyl-ACP methyl ester carboxylesterase
MNTSSSTSKSPDTIVLIHGLWMTPLSWEHWVARYEQAGYRVLAPAWPGMDGTVEQLRADTSAYAHLGVAEVVDHYDAIIQTLDTAPIIMGHSFGGAFTEILLPLSTLHSSFPVLGNTTNTHKAVMLSPQEFHYSFTNTLTEAESAPGTSVTPYPARASCCSRPHWPISTPTRRRKSTSTMTIGRLC